MLWEELKEPGAGLKEVQMVSGRRDAAQPEHRERQKLSFVSLISNSALE